MATLLIAFAFMLVASAFAYVSLQDHEQILVSSDLLSSSTNATDISVADEDNLPSDAFAIELFSQIEEVVDWYKFPEEVVFVNPLNSRIGPGFQVMAFEVDNEGREKLSATLESIGWDNGGVTTTDVGVEVNTFQQDELLATLIFYPNDSSSLHLIFQTPELLVKSKEDYLQYQIIGLQLWANQTLTAQRAGDFGIKCTDSVLLQPGTEVMEYSLQDTFAGVNILEMIYDIPNYQNWELCRQTGSSKSGTLTYTNGVQFIHVSFTLAESGSARVGVFFAN